MNLMTGFATQKLSKKEARQLVYNKLTDALAEFKDVLKKKSLKTAY
jgi:hypothetical protein